jgi:hypothetical protein
MRTSWSVSTCGLQVDTVCTCGFRLDLCACGLTDGMYAGVRGVPAYVCGEVQLLARQHSATSCALCWRCLAVIVAATYCLGGWYGQGLAVGHQGCMTHCAAVHTCSSTACICRVCPVCALARPSTVWLCARRMDRRQDARHHQNMGAVGSAHCGMLALLESGKVPNVKAGIEYVAVCWPAVAAVRFCCMVHIVAMPALVRACWDECFVNKLCQQPGSYSGLSRQIGECTCCGLSKTVCWSVIAISHTWAQLLRCIMVVWQHPGLPHIGFCGTRYAVAMVRFWDQGRSGVLGSSESPLTACRHACWLHRQAPAKKGVPIVTAVLVMVCGCAKLFLH